MDISKLLIQAANLSISASWLVLAVLAARVLLKKAPRWIHVALWGIVGLRLVLPVSWESMLSLLPSQETIPQEIVTSPTPGIQSGVPMIDSFVNPVIQQQLAPNLTYTQEPTPMETLMTVGAIVWLVGMALMLGYTLFTYIRLRRRVTTAVRLEANVYQSEFVTSPFVLGLLRPRIYLPYGLEGEARTHVLAHEQAHIRRKDHWWKPLGFLLLTVYWFNPLLWVAYVLLCRDIELACDEKVVKKLETRQRADYSQALLSCSVSRRSIAACPLAFGEVGVKQRIKSVLNYKKPAFWLILVAVIACIALAVGFLTDPASEGVSVDQSIKITLAQTGGYKTDLDTSAVDAQITGAMHLGAGKDGGDLLKVTLKAPGITLSVEVNFASGAECGVAEVEGEYRILLTRDCRHMCLLFLQSDENTGHSYYISVADSQEEQPSPQFQEEKEALLEDVELLGWASRLKAEDVKGIELYVYDGSNYRHARLTEEQIEKAVETICSASGTPIERFNNLSDDHTIVEFVLNTAEDVYVVGGYYGQVLKINGYYYSADLQWLAGWYDLWSQYATNPIEQMKLDQRPAWMQNLAEVKVQEMVIEADGFRSKLTDYELSIVTQVLRNYTGRIIPQAPAVTDPETTLQLTMITGETHLVQFQEYLYIDGDAYDIGTDGSLEWQDLPYYAQHGQEAARLRLLCNSLDRLPAGTAVTACWLQKTYTLDGISMASMLERIQNIKGYVYPWDASHHEEMGHFHIDIPMEDGSTVQIQVGEGFVTIGNYQYAVDNTWSTEWYAELKELLDQDLPVQTDPPVPSVDNLTWAQTLRVEDVESMAVYAFGNGGERYAQLTDMQIAEAVALIRECHGKRVPPELPPPPGGSVRFEVSTKDGIYVVSNGAGSHLFINEDCYEADHDWLAGWWEWSSIATNRVPGTSEVRYTLQTYVPLYTLEELSAQVTLDSNGRLMIQDTDAWGPLLGQLYQAESGQLPDWALSDLPNLQKTCQELKDLVGKPGQLWICPYNYPTSGIMYLKLFLLYQTEDGTLYLGATKYQNGDKNDDQLLYLYELRMMVQSAEDPLIWAKNLKAEDITAMTLHVRGEYYRLEIGSSDFEKYLGYIQNAHGTRLDTMENAYAFDVTILVDTKDGMRHVVINDSGEKLMIDGYYYQAGTDWLYSWWDEWRQS